jgi:hypothetical protein
VDDDAPPVDLPLRRYLADEVVGFVLAVAAGVLFTIGLSSSGVSSATDVAFTDFLLDLSTTFSAAVLGLVLAATAILAALIPPHRLQRSYGSDATGFHQFLSALFFPVFLSMLALSADLLLKFVALSGTGEAFWIALGVQLSITAWQFFSILIAIAAIRETVRGIATAST